MILRVKFTKESYLKYISHLDLMRLFNRTFRRASIPIKYSEGFNPQPKFSIANPLALGIASESEYMDIELEGDYKIEDFIYKMNKELPEGIKILEGKCIEDDRSLSSLVAWSYYELRFKANNLNDEKELDKLIQAWLDRDKIIIIKTRRKRKKIIEKEQDIKPLIGNVVINAQSTVHNPQLIKVNCLLKAGDKGNLKPTDFIDAMNKQLNLDIDFDSLEVKRIGLFLEYDGKVQLPI